MFNYKNQKKLKISLEKVNLQEIFDLSVAAVSNSEESRFNVAIQDGVKAVIANKDKLEQNETKAKMSKRLRLQSICMCQRSLWLVTE